MDLLNRRDDAERVRAKWPWLLVAACSLAVAFASCFQSATSRVPTFPHDVHVATKQLACTFCHVTAKTADLPSMPPPELCAPCHDKKDVTQPFAQWTAAWFEDGGRFRRRSQPSLAGDVVFRHGDHTGTARLACTECHTEIKDEREVPSSLPDWKRTCMDCHQRSGLDPSNCRSCHTQIDKDHLPQTHFHAWDQRHGDVVRSGDDQSQNRCELCHDQQSSCTNCHQNNPPKNHDNLFRLRTHGVLASIDRSRCYTCHRTDSCEECHGTTRPLSHRGGFGTSAQRHCNSCHFPLGDEGCAVCHRSTPSHQQAAPLPASHTASMNCRQCHGNGQALPHPDGGHPCTICHH